MLRGENVIAGTSTTGTGTLTLAACPSPPGGLDPYAAFQAMGFGTSQSSPMSYVLIEFTDATFATAKQLEKGIGSLLIGANVAATTLARTTIQETQTGLNTSTPSLTISAPTAITIGTAANCLVFIGAAANDTMAALDYFDSGTNSGNTDGVGIGPLVPNTITGSFTVANNTIYYAPFYFPMTLLVSKARLRVQVAYTGGTSNAYFALYHHGTSGKPVKLLADFGALGAGGSALTSAGAIIASSALASPVLLRPGWYIAAVQAQFSGGAGTPTIRGGVAFMMAGALGTSSLAPVAYVTAASAGATAFADPSLAPSGWSSNTAPFYFTLGS